MVTVTTTYNADFKGSFNNLLKKLRENIALTNREFQGHIKKTYFSDVTTPTTVKNRSSHLRNSVHPDITKIEGAKVSSGMLFGKRYAKTHIGPKGQYETIRAKSGKALAIPMTWIPEAAKVLLTPAGVLRGGPKSKIFADTTFIKKSEAGNAIIFGKPTYAKGKKAGQAKGDIVPLFLLRKQVRVPYRLHPKDMFKWFMERFIKTSKDEGII